MSITGELCEIDVNECESSPCMHQSRCVDLNGGFKCECLPGYTGPTCAVDIDECEYEPCKNNAQCLNLLNR